jgi:hypothetical protein
MMYSSMDSRDRGLLVFPECNLASTQAISGNTQNQVTTGVVSRHLACLYHLTTTHGRPTSPTYRGMGLRPARAVAAVAPGDPAKPEGRSMGARGCISNVKDRAPEGARESMFSNLPSPAPPSGRVDIICPLSPGSLASLGHPGATAARALRALTQTRHKMLRWGVLCLLCILWFPLPQIGYCPASCFIGFRQLSNDEAQKMDSIDR